MTNIDPTMGGQAGAAPDEGGGATGSTKEMIGKAGQTVRQEAAHFASQAQQRAAGEIEKHKATATQTLGSFANAIRRAGDELSTSDQSMAARFVGQAADGLENFARALSEKRPEDLLDTVRDFSRRNPTAFVAGTVLAGLALGRFLRSSEPGGEMGFAANAGGADWTENEPAVFTGVGEDTGATGLGATGDVGVDVGAAESLEAQVSGGIGGVSGATEDDALTEADIDGTTPTGGDTDRSRFGGSGV
ncbi:hypothetical protein [Phenylobacterium sp.]|uniref:hypothetical protein n=1 Tax=Phenylobacterium sp. TaxID=1871053 RepID=UPI0035AFF009